MNCKLHIYTLLALLPALLFFACADDGPDLLGAEDEVDDSIIFHVAMPGVEVTSRSYDNLDARDLQGGFSVAAIAPEIPSGGGKNYTIYFSPQLVKKTEGMDNAFRGDFCKWPDYTETNMGSGKLDFCAFYPSLETMREKSGVGSDTEFFKVHDVANGTTYSYRMGNFKVNKDISRHMDFVGAFASGSKASNLYSGISLEFEHKLCRVDLKAWGNNPGYDIEIAGVRIGGAIVKSTYNMNGNWIHNSIVWDCVEYTFNEGDASAGREADTVVRIGKGNYDTAASATSIMGKGGSAIVIPHYRSNLTTAPAKWNHTTDPSNSSKRGMYISVLMRVIDKTDSKGLVLYPYVEGSVISEAKKDASGKITVAEVNANDMKTVYLSVDKTTGKVLKTVYKSETTKKYFQDSGLSAEYVLPANAEIRSYCWAAVPFVASWYIANSYTYVLDYSSGVGVGDPDDVNRGRPIITPLSVGVSSDEAVWDMVKAYDEKEIEITGDELKAE